MKTGHNRAAALAMTDIGRVPYARAQIDSLGRYASSKSHGSAARILACPALCSAQRSANGCGNVLAMFAPHPRPVLVSDDG